VLKRPSVRVNDAARIKAIKSMHNKREKTILCDCYAFLLFKTELELEEKRLVDCIYHKEEPCICEVFFVLLF
jgi:hypothetical protein